MRHLKSHSGFQDFCGNEYVPTKDRNCFKNIKNVFYKK